MLAAAVSALTPDRRHIFAMWPRQNHAMRERDDASEPGLWSVRLLGAAVLASFVATSLLVARAFASHSLTLFFLGKNLTLGWTPVVPALLFAVAMRGGAGTATGRSRALALASGATFLAWLALYPNSFYVATDIQHMHERAAIPAQFDVLVFLAMGLAGMLVSALSFETVLRAVVARVGAGRLGTGARIAFMAAAQLLAAVGIYIGRFFRWNSWDIPLRPASLALELAARLRSPVEVARMTTFVTPLFLMLVALSLVMHPILFRPRRTLAGDEPRAR